MKKVILTLVLAFGMFAANAQVWIGGSASGHVQKKDWTANIAPEVGYHFNDSPISIAAAFNFVLLHDVDFNEALDLDEKSVFWGCVASPYVRFNLANVEKFSFFLDVTGDIMIPFTGYRVAVRPGIAWNATEHWTAACRIGMLGYTHWKDGYEIVEDFMGTEILGTNGFNFGFQAAIPTIGLYYNF